MPDSSGLLKKVMSFFSFESEDGDIETWAHADAAVRVIPVKRV